MVAVSTRHETEGAGELSRGSRSLYSDIGGGGRRNDVSERTHRWRAIAVWSLILVLAATIRLLPAWRTGFTPDADEAIVGLMGLHILEGAPPPTFYYGQAYMGALEPMLAAAMFGLFGPTSVALKLVPFIWSLLLIPATVILARACVPSSRFHRLVPLLAALYVAVPPAALAEWSTRARGGFIEIVVAAAVLLALGINWLRSPAPRLSSTLVLGLLCGFSWWTNNQILLAMLPIGILCGLKLTGVLLLGLEADASAKSVTSSADHRVARWGYTFLQFGAALIGLLCGGAPYFVYNIANGWPSLGMFKVTESISGNLAGLATKSLPVLGGARRLWEDEDLFWGSSAILIATCILLGFGFVRSGLKVLRRCGNLRIMNLMLAREQARPLIPYLVLSLYVVLALVVFAISSYGSLTKAPRYLFALYPAFGVIFGLAVAGLREAGGSRARFWSYGLVVAVFVLNISSNVAKGGLAPGEPLVFKQERVARDHGPLISWLEEHNYSWVSTNYWVGYRLAFETRERVRFLMFRDPYQVRIPEYEMVGGSRPTQDVPFVLFRSQFEMVAPAFERLDYSFKVGDVGDYRIIYDLRVPPPLENKKLPIDASEVSASHGNESAYFAVDGDMQTRYGSAHPQTPGMVFRVDFHTPRTITEVDVDWGKWHSDAARGLSIVCEYPDGEAFEILTRSEYEALRYVGDFFRWPLRFRLRAPRICRSLVLTQLAGDRIFDWSIAELTIFGPVSGGS